MGQASMEQLSHNASNMKCNEMFVARRALGNDFDENRVIQSVRAQSAPKTLLLYHYPLKPFEPIKLCKPQRSQRCHESFALGLGLSVLHTFERHSALHTTVAKHQPGTDDQR